MHIVFLDISGVIDPIDVNNRPKSDRFDRRIIHRVNEVAKGAKIVLSSDWVGDPTQFPWVCEELKKHGLNVEIIGHTVQPWGQHLGYRASQIKRWLDEHPEVTNYVVIDDRPLAVGKYREYWPEDIVPGPAFIPDIPDMADHFVWVDQMNGLTTADARRAIRILQGSAKPSSE